MVPVLIPDGWPSTDFQRLPADDPPRDPQTIVNRELCAAERVIWDAAWEHVRRLENADNAQSLHEHWSVWIDWCRRGLAAASSRRKMKSPVFPCRTKPGRKVHGSPTPAFRDLSFRRVRALR